MKPIILSMFIVIFVLLVIIYPFKIKWSFHINLLKNIGFIVFKVLFIRLLCERFKFNEKGKIEEEREKKEKNKDKTFMHAYIFNLAKRVDVKHVDFIYDIGLEDNAYLICLLSGYIEAFLSVLYSYFLNNYKDIKIFSSNNPDFEKQKVELTGKIIVSFNLIDVFISLIKAYKYSIKNKKEKNV